MKAKKWRNLPLQPNCYSYETPPLVTANGKFWKLLLKFGQLRKLLNNKFRRLLELQKLSRFKKNYSNENCTGFKKNYSYENCQGLKKITVTKIIKVLKNHSNENCRGFKKNYSNENCRGFKKNNGNENCQGLKALQWSKLIYIKNFS